MMRRGPIFFFIKDKSLAGLAVEGREGSQGDLSRDTGHHLGRQPRQVGTPGPLLGTTRGRQPCRSGVSIAAAAAQHAIVWCASRSLMGMDAASIG